MKFMPGFSRTISRHVRQIAVAALPKGAPLEIEAIADKENLTIMGQIMPVNIGNKKGEKKTQYRQMPALSDRGPGSDATSACEIRQISLLAAESIEKIRQKGLHVRLRRLCGKPDNHRY
jgi:hypothetical protein